MFLGSRFMKFRIELEVGFSNDAVINPSLFDDLKGSLQSCLDNSTVREVFDDCLFEFFVKHFEFTVKHFGSTSHPLCVKGLRVLNSEGSPLTKHRVVDRLVEECGCEDVQEPVKRFYVVDKDTGSAVDYDILDFASFLSTRLKSSGDFDSFLVFVDEVSAENSRRYYELLNKTMDSVRDLDRVKLEQIFEFVGAVKRADDLS
jgi:hypothetical protein